MQLLALHTRNKTAIPKNIELVLLPTSCIFCYVILKPFLKMV